MRIYRGGNRDPLWILGYLGLVLVPAMLLGWFSLRAVESERAATHRRLLDDQQAYANLASRIVHQELETLAESWAAFVPRAVGWENRQATMRQAVQRARGHAFIREAFLFHVAGGQLYPPVSASSAGLTTPDPQQARRFQELLAAGDNAEFEENDLSQARSIYEQLLAEVQMPQLRAIALTYLGRVALASADFDEALRIQDKLIREYPQEWDLENRPVVLYAMLQRARVLEELGRSRQAAQQLIEAYAWLLEHSGAIGNLQFELTREAVRDNLRRLLPHDATSEWQLLADRLQQLQAQEKKPTDANYFAQKLSRKLARAWLDELPYSTPLRYVSDASGSAPFLLVYFFLPDDSGTHITGLVGFQVDLPELAAELLPGLLNQVQLAESLHLAVVDDAGQNVLSHSPAPGSPDLARVPLTEPFGFWSVSVRSFEPGVAEEAIDFRTRVLLYGILLLLLTMVGGVVLVILKLRHEKQLSRQKTNFVSSVSHELRTPLTSIRMFAEMLEGSEDGALGAERRRYLRTIRRECDRLQRLIESILDFTSLEKGTRKLQLEYEEIGTLVTAIAEEFRGQAEQNGFQYSVDIEADLPELLVDADALRQVLLNLLTNALKYSDRTRSISVRVFSTSSEVAIEVRDQGIGIAAKEQSRVFEDFYRVDTRVTASRSGLGLGLTLVRALVRAHGGRVSLESELNKGACFTVWLPRSADAVSSDGNPSERLAAEA